MSRRTAAMWMLWALLALSATAHATTIEYIHTDALGSIVAVTDATGAEKERREWEPYGEQLTPAPSNGPGYTGHVQDASTGLVYMQQRYYDPVVGRFLSVDPVAADTGTAWNLNRYNYAANNPYKFTDPDGRLIDTIADIGFVAYSAYTLANEPSWTNAAALGADVVGAVVPFATGLGAGVRAAAHADEVVDAARGASNAADAGKGADFIVTPAGTAVPTSQSQMQSGLEAAGIQGTPLPGGKGTSYALPDGKTTVRAMEPSGQAPRRASFENSNGGGPVNPDGKVPQPSRGASSAEKREYVRERTHVTQTR